MTQPHNNEPVFGPDSRLIVIGCGNMGGALVRGAFTKGLIGPGGLVVVEPRQRAEEVGLSGLPVAWRARIEDVGVLRASDVVVLAVKPQVFAEVGFRDPLTRSLVPGTAVVSIMAGVTLDRLSGVFGERAIVRAMPNLPASIGLGATAISFGHTVQHGTRGVVRRLFESVSEVTEIDEALMDAFTAVAGSGPAYVFHLAESMIGGAVRAGFSREDAERAVRRTILGAATMLARDTTPAAMWRARVTSKGGTTEAAMEVLEQAGVAEAMARAIAAARERGRELGG